MIYDARMLRFFENLSENNQREWFLEHKNDYEQDLVVPTTLLVSAMGPLLNEISPYLKADPRRSGGSMFRIYRDTRFSKDKTPYKTWVAVQFPHVAAKDVHAPGYYFSANHAQFVVGCGIWHPEKDALQSIRAAIDADPHAWESALNAASFKEYFSLGGESLKRPPKGFSKDHPLVKDLMRKDFIGMATHNPEWALDTELPQKLIDHYRAAVPFMSFLCQALKLPF